MYHAINPLTGEDEAPGAVLTVRVDAQDKKALIQCFIDGNIITNHDGTLTGDGQYFFIGAINRDDYDVGLTTNSDTEIEV